MAVTVKKIVLWRKEVENRTGILASALAPLANAGADIHVVMAYRFPGQESKAAIELYPVYRFTKFVFLARFNFSLNEDFNGHDNSSNKSRGG
jgi:hypothetical protein